MFIFSSLCGCGFFFNNFKRDFHSRSLPKRYNLAFNYSRKCFILFYSTIRRLAPVEENVWLWQGKLRNWLLFRRIFLFISGSRLTLSWEFFFQTFLFSCCCCSHACIGVVLVGWEFEKFEFSRRRFSLSRFSTLIFMNIVKRRQDYCNVFDIFKFSSSHHHHAVSRWHTYIYVCCWIIHDAARSCYFSASFNGFQK